MNPNIQILPAAHGEAIILHCSKGDKKGVIVIDGGPYVTAKNNAFIVEVEKNLPIDLMVMTHFDDDHLVGIKKFIEVHRNDNPFPVKRLWTNCAKHISFDLSENFSSAKASTMADVLLKISENSDVKWNFYVLDGFNDETIDFADIDVINPRVDLLDKFLKEYKAEYAKESLTDNLSSSSEAIRDIDISMQELAKRPKTPGNPNKYSELANMVSISMIIRCDEFSMLTLGDSFPQEIYQSLIERGYSKENKLKVDYVKMPHHGSAENISNELLDIIDCDKYLISTNGGRGYRHPHREALANVLCHAERKNNHTAYFYFNYDLDLIQANRNEDLFNKELDKDLNYDFL